MPANDKSDWQIEKNKQKTTTTKRGHRCSCSASGIVRFLGHKRQLKTFAHIFDELFVKRHCPFIDKIGNSFFIGIPSFLP